MENCRKQKILIADDSELNREILSAMLEDEYNIMEAENGIQAVAALSEHRTDIAMLLLDITMPEMDGFAVLDYMNKYHWIEEIPVIVISAEDNPASIKRAYDLGVTDYMGRPFDTTVVRRRIANTLLLYAKQRRLLHIVADQIYEKEKSNQLMVSILSHIVEFRNGESGLHVIHISLITRLVLKRLLQKTDTYMLSNADIALISLASAFHDIGKISIPDEVLNKPGRLTAKEFEIMKRHSMVGADMLHELPVQERNEPLIRVAYEICRWHHERYDGGGYPDGLQGDDIPISAQVVSLADVYDALTSERCYKKAYSHEQAMDMILNGQCGAFNPLLLECLKEIGSTLQEELKINSGTSYGTQEFQDMANQLQAPELVSSERVLRMLEYERQRVQFLTDAAKDIIFFYSESPPLLNLNEPGVLKLGLDKNMTDPMQNPLLLANIPPDSLNRLKDKLGAASPAEPIVQMELEIRIEGELRWNRLICRTLWGAETDERYMGIAGTLIDVHDEYRHITSLKEEIYHYEVENDRLNIIGHERNGHRAVTGKEAWLLMRLLDTVFDAVRLVDASTNYEIHVDRTGTMRKVPYNCYAVWSRDSRCDNCISAKCLSQKSRFEKFEFLGNEIYFVIAYYVEVDGQPCSMEMITRMTEDTLFDGHGKEEVVQAIFEYNKKVYIDSLTGVNNRRYYEEQLRELSGVDAVLFADVDKFKNVNDLYGHQTGDMVLRLIADAICSSVRKSDSVVRYGGDEFIVIFRNIPFHIFKERAMDIQRRIKALSIEEYPDICFSASIGGIYGPGNTAELLQTADEQMYRAKREGCGICLARGEMQ